MTLSEIFLFVCNVRYGNKLLSVESLVKSVHQHIVGVAHTRHAAATRSVLARVLYPQQCLLGLWFVAVSLVEEVCDSRLKFISL